MQADSIQGFRLSLQQQRLWLLQRGTLDPVYSSVCALRLVGKLDRGALVAALRRTVARHEILRTAFQAFPGLSLPLQVIHRDGWLDLQEVDLSNVPPAQRRKALAELTAAAERPTFDLSRGEVLRGWLAALSAEESELVLALPAVCADTPTLSNLTTELMNDYAELRGSHRSEEGEPPLQYADVTEWQYQLLEEEETADELARWRASWLEWDIPIHLALRAPFEAAPANGGSFHPFSFDVIPVRLGPAVEQAAAALLSAWNVPARVFFLACWQMLLQRSTGREDVLIGVLHDGRRHEELRSVMGPLARYVPVYCQLGDALQVREVVERVRAADEAVERAQERFSWPHVAGAFDPERPPYFPFCFSAEELGEYAGDGLRVAVLRRRTLVDHFKLELCCHRTGGHLLLDLRYDDRLLSREAAEMFGQRFAALVRGIVERPGAPWSEIEILGDAERRRLLVDFNDAPPAASQECLHRRFEAQVERTPEQLAVVDAAGIRLTYAELNARANQLAHYLRRLGVGPEVPVALCLDRSVEALVAILGIAKAGGAWLPLDPAQPLDRLRWILEDTAPPLLLTQERLAAALSLSHLQLGLRTLCLATEAAAVAAQSTTNLADGALPGNLAYRIYTSGSTGRPKGVQVEHRAAVNLFAALQTAVLARLPQPPERPLRASLNAPFFFDASVQQIVLLLGGHALYVVPDEVRTDGAELLRFVQENALNLFDCTPSQLRILVAAGLLTAAGSVPQGVLMAGEAVDDALWRSLQRAQRTVFFNIYGPTECTVDATAHRIDRASSSPTIGRPLAGYEIYLLDAARRLVPLGTAGELCIGGAGLARGYEGRPDATAEKLIPHPFNAALGARLYRTGDLARHLPDGDIEYLGRIDDQVKIRGYRIEPGEIEAALTGHPWVQAAVVAAWRESAEQVILAAYVLPTEAAPADSTALHRGLSLFLRERLPAYMVPAAYTVIGRWPLTPNGKLDRKALPPPDLRRAGTGKPHAAPRSPTEELIASTWEEVLGIERVGIHESFFDLGGHSLLATKLISRLREVLPGDVSVRQLFEGPTVAEMAAALQRSAEVARDVPPITPVSRNGTVPLSFAQQRLWFLQQLEPDSTAYNLRTAVRLVGRLDRPALRAGLREIVHRHEALRTTFEMAQSEPVQILHPETPLCLGLVDLCGIPEAHRRPEAQRIAREQVRRPFDLARPPLLREALLALGDEEHVLLLTLHHIISDGWSTGIMVRELVALYSAFREGRPSPLPELSLTYADFAAWQRRWLSGDTLDAEIDYWKGQLHDLPPLLDLPADRPRPAAPGLAAAYLDFALPDTLAQRARAFARARGATLFMTLLAAFQALLSRITGRSDIAVGSPIAGRNHRQTEELVGFFVNTLTLRTDFSGRPGFAEILRRVREMTLETYAHQDLPFEKLVEEMQPERDLSYTPLFQVLFTLEHQAAEPPSLPGLRVEPFLAERAVLPFDLTLSLADNGERLAGALDYSRDLFDAPTVLRMEGHLCVLLDGLLAFPERPLVALPLLTAGELRQVLVEWNDTFEPDEPPCIHRIFQERARRSPEAPAVISAQGNLSYRELDTRSDQMARRLVTNGVGPEVVVGLYAGRSPALLVGMLAVLKAGGAYLPLDPLDPPDRVAYYLADSGARVVMVQDDLPAHFPADGPAKILRLDIEDPSAAARLPERVPPQCAAYVIYTSGSTGKPKGVSIPHAALASYSLEMVHRFGLTATDRILQFAPLGFDVVVEEIFPTLAAGAAVVLHDKDLLLAPTELSRVIVENAVTGLELPAAFWNEWVYDLTASGRALPPSLRFVLVGCDKPSPERLAAWRALGGPRLLFVFGLTETTVTSTLHIFPAGSPADRPGLESLDLPIGRPVANARVYILDQELQPVPVRAVGQLFIAGAGVGRGYLGRPELTAERFVPDPFADTPGARLYRTGDLSRYRPDGAVEFLGRLDHQVKIRGFRVEPGEVEAMLREHPAVREAAVLARQDRPGEWRLAAYCVATQDAGARNGELRRFLRERLPEHMVPTFSIFLPALPLTANGKLDRQALLRIQPEILSAGLAAEGSGTPRNRAEELLARIWGQVLRLEKVGVHDNFFELGGDSILSIQVSSRAFQEGLRITPRQMFERQTIAELAAVAEWLSGIPLPETGPVTGPVPLTPIQCEFFAQDQPSPGHFNQALLLTVGAVDGERVTPSALRRAVAGLLVHHDALRMRFAPAPGDAPPWRQVNDPPGEETPFVQVDLSALPPEQRRSALEDCAARLQKSLDLTAGPLWRTALFTLSCGEPDRLLVIAHHLIVDGVSWRIVLEDLETLCHRLSLPPKTTSFQRWAERLSDYAVSTAAAAQAEAWIGRLRSIPARLPVDFSGGANDLASARAVVVSLDTEETRTLLTQVPRAYRTQINDVLLTALAEALGSWTGDRRLLVDLESHGREELFADLDLGRTVGYFTSICPLHLDLEGLESPGEALKAVKEELRSMPQRGIGFGILRHLGAAPVRERLAALPQPEVIFNYLGQLDQAVAGDRLFQPATESAGPAQDPRQRRAHRLEINGGVRNGRLSMVWTYSESFHRVATIEGVASRFLAALRELIRHCLQPGAGGVTPSDFPLGRLDQPALDRIATAVGGKIADLYPASPAQQGMLFHSLHDAGSGVYLAQMSFDLNVDLDVAAFEHAWQEVVRRHTILRSAFVWRDLLEPVQVVFEDVPLDWEHHDWRALTSTEQEERLAAHLRNDWDRPLDLARPPLMRLILIRLDEQRYRFVWDHHHLLLDGWSLPILWRELFQIYEARRRGEKIRLEPARPYRDYIAWLLQQDLAAAEELWRRTLAGFTATTPLAVDRMAATAQGSSTGVRESVTSAGLLDALQGLARRRQLTINTLVQGAWALLLSRYSGERDVVFGGVTSGRSAPIPGMESMVGMFINTLPVRVQVPLAMPLLAWLRGIQEQQAEMRQYEYSPLSQVLGWSEVPRGTALFESILAFENFPRDQSLRRQAGEGLRIGAVDIEEQTNYPLNLVVAPGSRLQLRVLYQPGRLDGVTVARMMHHLEALLDGMVTGADGTLDALPILTAAERQQALLEWNDFAKECPQVPMVHELCALHARRRPEATAVASRQDRLTYGDLEARSNRLAHHLRSRGVGPDVLVALCTERTLERVVGIVSVLKAGGAYVSLDPTYPKDRLAFLLDDARALVLLTQSKLAGLLPESGAAVIQLDGDWNAIRGDETQPPVSGVTPDNLAYVVYTSGSTGKPKGVEIPHAGLMNLVRWHQDLYEVKPEDRGTQVASPAFDASIWELWPYLAAGASVYIPDEETRLSSSRMVRWWSEVGITLAYLMTPLAEGVLEEQIPPGLELATRALIIGGDRLHRGPDPAVSFRLMNHYGPAEYSVTSTVVRVPPAGQGNGIPTIGRPVDNTQIYLLDRCFNPVPIGVPGELFVAGAGLARSYLRRPDLTAEKFVPDPFSGEPGARMYRTADLVRYMPDGDMDFLGRLDHQVKIRGLRIELGEIETVLGQYPLVREAAVLVREDVPGDKRLVAYLVPAGEAPAVEELRMFLKERLPEYMVPAAFVSLPALPLTPNGKVDRRALPAPEWKEAEAYVAPRTSTEELLAGIWSEILKIDRVGVRSGFFELGGHSLLATQVISGVRKVFGVELPLRAIFESPTVGELAGVVEAALCQTGAAAVAPPLARVPRSGPSPLSFGQQRLWFLDQLQPGGSVFNVPSSYLLRGALHLTTLARAFEEVVRRHEVLRTVFFTAESGEPVQVVLPPAPLPLPLVDLTALPEAERRREQTRLNAVEGQRPFNLASGPLLRALCVRLAADEHALLIVMHHIISDGWSHSLLLQEITDLCIAYAAGRQSPLPELPLQYADFAHWQRQWLSGEVLQAELDYWRAQLRDLPGPLELPKDRPLPAHPKRRSASASLRLDRPLAERLEALARREGATLFMVLLAVLRILLYRQAGQSDLLLGTPVAGRQRSELEGLIGFFLNTLVLRIDLAAVSTFTELLARERSSALEAYAHQTVPFERILQEVQPERDLRYTPLFQMLFNMLELPEPQIGSADLTYEPLPPPEVGTAFDLTLYAGRGRQGIRLTATYDAEQFDAVRIDEMLAQLAGLIAQVVEEPDVRLDQLSLVTPAAQAVLPDPTVPLPAPACEPLARLLLAQMESLPQAPAVCQGACRWTYAELGGHAHALAHRLQRAGGAGRVVAVCGPRSPELIGALAGVVLAGGVLLTLDRKLPEQRQRLMLREAGAACLVYAGELRHEDEWMLREPGLQVLPVPQAEVTAASAFEPAAAFPRPGPDDPAYLFFTSGTTGKPKAVLGRQKGLSHFLLWQRATFAIGPHDRSAQLTGLSFDVVLRDIFLPLISGAALCLPDDDNLGPEAVLPWLEAKAVTVLHTVPSLAAFWLERVPEEVRLARLRWTFFAGEPLPASLIEKWRESFPQSGGIVNLYGPTETTLAKCFYRVPAPPAPGIQPAGFPLPQTQVLVLSGDRLCGIGEVGEVVLRTPFRSLGYLQAEEEGRRRFHRNPFRDDAEDLVYRTGDRGRYRPDGALDLLGRIDDQIKIRGMRVEPEEVRAVLERIPKVRACAVVAREDVPGEKRLVAYLVPEREKSLSPREVRRELESQLPDFMVPSAFVMLEALPLTPNGKLDRNALPAPGDLTVGDAERAAPRNSVEQELVRIWEELLHVQPIGVCDDFFELGGHSLLILRLRARLEESFGRTLPVADFFRHTTIEDLALALRRESEAAGVQFLVPIHPRGSLPPFYCVHPAGGDAAVYQRLAEHLGPEQPFYSFQAKGLENDEEPHRSIEDMARAYLEELRIVQPAGPYHLGGWSFGGRVAFEMALQLSDQGEPVASLILMDSGSPLAEVAERGPDGQILAILVLLAESVGLALSEEDLLPLDTEGRLARVAADLVAAGVVPDPEAARAQLIRRIKVLKATGEAGRKHHPRAYSGPITYLRAESSETSFAVAGDPSRGWSHYSLQPVTVQPVPGDHYTLIQEPYVQTLADVLREALRSKVS